MKAIIVKICFFSINQMYREDNELRVRDNSTEITLFSLSLAYEDFPAMSVITAVIQWCDCLMSFEVT
jgi:hypothetical protein